MERRELLSAFGAAAVGVVTLGGRDTRADDTAAHHHPMDKTHEDCLKACGDCAKACNMMAHHCLDKICEGAGDVKVHARAHSLAMDCQAFCALSAAMIARSSELMSYSCEACAEACHNCAEACEKGQDAAIKECARTCRDCERSCREMVRSMKGANATVGAR